MADSPAEHGADWALLACCNIHDSSVTVSYLVFQPSLGKLHADAYREAKPMDVDGFAPTLLNRVVDRLSSTHNGSLSCTPLAVDGTPGTKQNYAVGLYKLPSKCTVDVHRSFLPAKKERNTSAFVVQALTKHILKIQKLVRTYNTAKTSGTCV
jgi:hypothetical protein